MQHRRDLHAQIIESAKSLDGVKVEVARDALEAIGASTNDLPLLIAVGVLEVDLLDGRIREGMRASLAYGSLDHLRVIERFAR